jgi:hypothetical protein
LFGAAMAHYEPPATNGASSRRCRRKTPLFQVWCGVVCVCVCVCVSASREPKGAGARMQGPKTAARVNICWRNTGD